jgi:hypothetical protein
MASPPTEAESARQRGFELVVERLFTGPGVPKEKFEKLAEFLGLSAEEVRRLQGTHAMDAEEAAAAEAAARTGKVEIEDATALEGIDQIIARLDVGIAEERKEMDALLARLRTTRIAA